MGERAGMVLGKFFLRIMDYLNFYAVIVLTLPLVLLFLLVFIIFLPSFSFYFFILLYLGMLVFFIFLKFNYSYWAETRLFTWLESSEIFSVNFQILQDSYTIEFSIILLFLGLLIQWYAYFYFKKDPDLSRFSLLLGFFLAFMLLMINTLSWVFLFIAWEGVGLFSFLLVSFWFSKVSTFKSGIKVLFYNRIGDFFFFIILGFILFFTKTDFMGSNSALNELLAPYRLTDETDLTLFSLINFSLFLVILSKSAQFGFHIWLLEAMEAPLPASSLIHSATLVCAGIVFFFKIPNLMVNLGSLATILILWASATSMLLSTSAFFNYDIKKILAYSTGSHISIMLALSLTSGGAAGYTYTLLHASTKVFIFLLFGFIIDLNLGVRDLRKMGGFFHFEQLTYFGFFAVVALSSLPLAPLAAVKDLLIAQLLDGSFYMEVSAAFLMVSSTMNYLYMYRLFFKIFFGDMLSTLPTYFKNYLDLGDKALKDFKQSELFMKMQPLLFLFGYIILLEVLVNFFFYVDYGFTENRVVDMFNMKMSNSLLFYLSHINSFFFLVIFSKFLHRIFK